MTESDSGTDTSGNVPEEQSNCTAEPTVEVLVETLETLVLAADEGTPLTRMPENNRVADAVGKGRRLLD